MSEQAERSPGVYIITADGQKVICELSYDGEDVDGRDVWECRTPLGPGDEMYIDFLPVKPFIVRPVQ